MPTYSVLSTPTAIGQGFQAVTTLYNQGPDTVWLDDSASVSPLNGYALRPFETMTWQPNEPLYAVCRTPFSAAAPTISPDMSGRATLLANSAGNLMIPTANRLIPLYTSVPDNTFGVNYLNVAGFETIHIFFDTNNPVVNPTPFEVDLVWYDDDGRILQTAVPYQRFYWASRRNNHLTIPVQAPYLTISGVMESFFFSKGVRILGSTVESPDSFYLDPIGLDTAAAYTQAPFVGYKSLYWSGSSFTAAADTTKYYLPDWGRYVDVFMSFSNQPTNTTLALRSLTLNDVSGNIGSPATDIVRITPSSTLGHRFPTLLTPSGMGSVISLNNTVTPASTITGCTVVFSD